MELLEHAMDDLQGGMGTVSKWTSTDGTNVRVVVKVVPPPLSEEEKAARAAKFGSDTDTDTEASSYIAAADTPPPVGGGSDVADEGEDPADLLAEVRNGIEMAKKLATCNLVRFKAFEMEVDGEPRIVTVMESLSSDAFTVASGWNGLLPETYKGIAIKMADFLTRLLECVKSEKATLMDMKLENIGYCEDDGEFRLIDVDSLNSNTLTAPYNLKEYVDNGLQTDYAFGVTMAQFLLHTKTYNPKSEISDKMMFEELSYGHPVVLVTAPAGDTIYEARITGQKKPMAPQERLADAKFTEYRITESGERTRVSMYEITETGEQKEYKFPYESVAEVYRNHWWFRDGFENGKNYRPPPDKQAVVAFFSWLLHTAWTSKDDDMQPVRNLIQNAKQIIQKHGVKLE
jgi:hypothetical protein